MKYSRKLKVVVASTMAMGPRTRPLVLLHAAAWVLVLPGHTGGELSSSMRAKLGCTGFHATGRVRSSFEPPGIRALIHPASMQRTLTSG